MRTLDGTDGFCDSDDDGGAHPAATMIKLIIAGPNLMIPFINGSFLPAHSRSVST